MHGAHQLAGGVERELRHPRRAGLLGRQVERRPWPPRPAGRPRWCRRAPASRRGPAGGTSRALLHSAAIRSRSRDRARRPRPRPPGRSPPRTPGASRPPPSSCCDGHLGLGERAGLVGADDRGRPERLHREQPLDQRVLGGPSAARRSASDTDSVAGSPSGTSATITPSAKTNEPTSGWPVAPGPRTAAPRSPAPRTATRRAIAATCRCSGVFAAAPRRSAGRSGRTRSPLRWRTPPPCRCRRPRVVPMNAQLRASSVGVPAGAGSHGRRAGSLSPVSGALFTASSWASTSRQSAGTASPASSTTTSPGTTSRTGDLLALPVAQHPAQCAAPSPAASPPSARPSTPARNRSTAFSSTTPRIATASCRLPTSSGRGQQLGQDGDRRRRPAARRRTGR